MPAMVNLAIKELRRQLLAADRVTGDR